MTATYFDISTFWEVSASEISSNLNGNFVKYSFQQVRLSMTLWVSYRQIRTEYVMTGDTVSKFGLNSDEITSHIMIFRHFQHQTSFHVISTTTDTLLQIHTWYSTVNVLCRPSMDRQICLKRASGLAGKCCFSETATMTKGHAQTDRAQDLKSRWREKFRAPPKFERMMMLLPPTLATTTTETCRKQSKL